MRVQLLLTASLAIFASITAGSVEAAAATGLHWPFQLPLPSEQVWEADSESSSDDDPYEIDVLDDGMQDVEGGTNPWTPEKACGSGYKVIDSEPLGSAATVYLLYKISNGFNCVATIKHEDIGIPTYITAFLDVQGQSSTSDGGFYKYYAAVRSNGKGKCVRWGGSAYIFSYGSPWEHCG